MVTRYDDIFGSGEFGALLEVSERLGRNPLQVQAAGGNTSLEHDGAMWVKASGKWLAHARASNIMVPVDAAGMRQALASGDPVAKDANAFRVAGGAPELRASIETSLHALFDWPVVLHTHCVSTIATAVRADAEDVVASTLQDLNARYIPYVKPGWDLAMAIGARVTPGVQILVLGNHGLVVGGNTAAQAEACALRTSERFSCATPAGGVVSEDFAEWLQPTGWQAVANPAMQALVQDPARLALAKGNSLYPDHIVFLGPGVAIATDGEQPRAAAARAAKSGVEPELVLYPGRGAALPGGASDAAMALAECFAEVIMRIDLSAELKRLSDEEEYAILNWDAEKHRQALDASHN